MKMRAGKEVALLLVVAAVLLSFAASVQAKTYSVSTAAIQSGGVDAPAGGGDNYATGFEAADGFSPGYCGGQAGWTAFAASSSQGHIDTANPADGSQHARISKDQSIGTGNLTGCFSPLMAPQPSTPSIVSIDVAVSDLFGADYDVVPQAPSTGFLVTRFKFSWLGDIYVLDAPGGALNFYDTGTNWVVGPYQNVRMEIDPGAGTISYYYNNSLIYVGVIFAAEWVEQVVLLSDNYQVSDYGDFDNLDIQNMIDMPPPDHARFLVTKNFSDNNDAEVEVTLSCNTGLPLQQTTTISEGDPVNFVIGDFNQGELNCEVTEADQDGYTASYFSPNSVGDSSVSCEWEDLEGGQYLCEITNSLNQVTVDVTKEWIDENPQFQAQNIAEAYWYCTNVSIGGGPSNGSASGWLYFSGNPGSDDFSVYPDWETGTSCSITEVDLLESGIEVDDSDCDGLVLYPDAGSSCTIVNTRLYEGIPTLSQYGLALLALLMLGVGFVAYRRIA